MFLGKYPNLFIIIEWSGQFHTHKLPIFSEKEYNENEHSLYYNIINNV